MKKQRKYPVDEKEAPFNGELTAKPQKKTHAPHFIPEENFLEPDMDPGEMNPYDAKVSGYVGKNGKAVSKSRHDVMGSPTNAFTDIGHGRSSVVRRK